MILYRIEHKDTGSVLTGVTGNVWAWREPVLPRWESLASAQYCSIEKINELIETVVGAGLRSSLDDCELRAYRREPVPTTTSVKLKNVRKRIEQKILIERLKE